MRIKKSFKIFSSIIIHAVVVWVALALGYNSYKEVMYGIDPLAKAIKDSIKATFPIAVLLFSGLHFIFSIRKKAGEISLSLNQYVYVIVIYAALLNLFYFEKGKDILIPLNLSILYVAMFLLLYQSLRKTKINAQDWLPPIVYRLIIREPSQTDTKTFSLNPFIIAFMASMVICALLLAINEVKVAESVANIAYFLMVVGIGIEMFKVDKISRKSNEHYQS